MSDSDVLIIGGGPTGITAALLVAARGFSVRVLERASEIYDLPRAIVMDDEIQRVFQGLGLAAELAAITTPLRGAEFVDVDGKRIIGTELPIEADWPNGHHPNVAYYQPEFEAFLRRAALDRGVELELGVTAREVEQLDTEVVVDTDHGQRRATWLVAADGASSPIRKQLGIEFVDQGFDQDWLVLDTCLRRPVPSLSPLVQQICDPARPVTFVVGHGDYRRWEFQLQPGETREEMIQPERVWELLAPWLQSDDAELVRAVVYRFHATVADAMRDRRVFLAGDAAHQMPPFLGQGLCSGIRDGVNLAWKLDLVAKGIAPESLLDTYGEERLPHAAAVVAQAVDTGRLIDQLAGRESHGVALDAAYGGSRPAPHLEHGLRWGDHPAVGRQLPQPMVRAQPLDHRLGDGFGIVIDETSADDAAVQRSIDDQWGDLVTTVAVGPDSLPRTLPPGGGVIVRPDRYVAAVASNRSELEMASDALLRSIRGA